MLYTSIENSKIKELKKLQTKKHRDLTNLFLVEGYKIVKEAYQEGILKEVYLLEGEHNNVPLEPNYISSKVLNFLATTKTPQPIIGVCKKLETKTLGNNILMLDNIQDPGNLGTIIRSAVAFNIDTIILSNDSVDVYNEKVIRSSMGMLFKINIIYASLKDIIQELRKENYTIIGTKVDGGKSLNTFSKPLKYVIIMGNEGNGVRKEILDLCEQYLYIPMNENCESLNVGVATSIIAYSLNMR